MKLHTVMWRNLLPTQPPSLPPIVFQNFYANYPLDPVPTEVADHMQRVEDLIASVTKVRVSRRPAAPTTCCVQQTAMPTLACPGWGTGEEHAVPPLSSATPTLAYKRCSLLPPRMPLQPGSKVPEQFGMETPKRIDDCFWRNRMICEELALSFSRLKPHMGHEEQLSKGQRAPYTLAHRRAGPTC